MSPTRCLRRANPQAPAAISGLLGSLRSPRSAFSCRSSPCVCMCMRVYVCVRVCVLCALSASSPPSDCEPLCWQGQGPRFSYLCTLLLIHAVQIKFSIQWIHFPSLYLKQTPPFTCVPPPHRPAPLPFTSLNVISSHPNKN